MLYLQRRLCVLYDTGTLWRGVRSVGTHPVGSRSGPSAMLLVDTRKRYVVKHNLITEVYLMIVMETTTCFGLYWPSSGCLGNLRASYMHARARGVEISTYA